MECRTDDLLWNADDYGTQRAHMTRPPSLLAVFTFGGEVYSVSDNSCRENVVTVLV